MLAAAAADHTTVPHVTRRRVVASDDTWRIDVNCAFPGSTATRCCSCFVTASNLDRFSTVFLWHAYIMVWSHHRCRSSVNFKGARHIFCPKNMYEKLKKCPNFTWFLPEKLEKYPKFYNIFRKINKIPEFCTIFAQKMPEFYIIIARKYFSWILGGTCPLPSVSYAYGSHLKLFAIYILTVKYINILEIVYFSSAE